ncbi:TLD-domain-containing protein [Rhizoclosmatium globosum]|uniref:Oxidation resistance protein 1 n=1 Tax=Rhizoclosmatium globosum TaxID=329046 RepID=A0A1Y2CHR8_9FUNG|nr:TLD-domain-containing protein [Rhizoclosmatium globosum]|eukprot:ORY46601.1 TLD-domain-containing protein [Rhizoclosmatium globosum]
MFDQVVSYLQQFNLLTTKRASAESLFHSLSPTANPSASEVPFGSLDSSIVGLPPRLRSQMPVFAWTAMRLFRRIRAAESSGLACAEFCALAALLSKGDWTARSSLCGDCAGFGVDCFVEDAASVVVGGVVSKEFVRFVLTQNQSSYDSERNVIVPTGFEYLDVWAPACPLFGSLWNAVFSKALLGVDPSPMPSITYPNPSTESLDPCLLSPCDVFILSSYIKRHRRRSSISTPDSNSPEHWPLIYSSNTHGKSWGSLMNYIESTGSLVLIIKDMKGNLFGAYIPTPLECSPKFRGNEEAFLFSIAPEWNVFTPTGNNSNYVYFNYGMATLPNGIGFGGQLNFFGLFLNTSLDSGECRCTPTSSTYGNPNLAAILLIEPKEVDDRLVPERVKRGGASVLNSHPIESALLEMAGRERYPC